MRILIFVCAMAALSTSPTWAQSSPAPSPQPNPTAPASTGAFVKSQSIDEWRAAKLVGVSVLGADNKKIGHIRDVLIDHDGAAQAVVISTGGFLGVGSKTVAVPFKAMKWRTEGRTVEVLPTPGATGAAATSVELAKTDPAATEAGQGYPDVAVLDLTNAQLAQAPEFKYAPEATTPDAPTTPQTPQPPAAANSAPRSP